jgi:hypothetical protein
MKPAPGAELWPRLIPLQHEPGDHYCTAHYPLQQQYTAKLVPLYCGLLPKSKNGPMDTVVAKINELCSQSDGRLFRLMKMCGRGRRGGVSGTY